jgi:nucleoside-triphosphatase THEP1
MITITISGKQGEGKTRLMRCISNLLEAMGYNVVTEERTRDIGHVATYAPQSIYIRTKQVKAKV